MLSFEHPGLGDLPGILRLWNQAFGPQWPMTERLLRQTVEHDPYYQPEGCWVARDDSDVTRPIVGWVLSKSMKLAGPEVGRFQGKGGIGAVCVHPRWQRQGIATALLDRAEEFLRQHGVAPNTLYFPHHLLPGIPADCEGAVALFRGRGYFGFSEIVDMIRSLNGFSVPEATAAMQASPGVELRPSRPEEAAAVIKFVEREFPGGWAYAIRAHYARGASPADIVVAVEGGEVIGFCMVADASSNWLLPSVYWNKLLGEQYGGLGPIGMARDQRKRGLGLALCAVAAASLRERGVEQMAIDWTTLIAFYEQLGFGVWKRYLQASL